MPRAGKAVREHLRIMAAPLPTYTCDGCKAEGLNPTELRKHLATEKRSCVSCGKSLSLNKLLLSEGPLCAACALSAAKAELNS